MVYCSGLENLPGKQPETAEMAEFCGSEDAQDATFTNRSAGCDGTEVGTPSDRVDLRGADLIKEAVTAYWGERCPDFDANCACCQAWAQLDSLVGALRKIASFGKQNPGHGFSCARMAQQALDAPIQDTTDDN